MKRLTSPGIGCPYGDHQHHRTGNSAPPPEVSPPDDPERRIDLKLLAPSTNYPPVTKCDCPIALHLGRRAHGQEESRAAPHMEVDFAAQLTSGHESGFVSR